LLSSFCNCLLLSFSPKVILIHLSDVHNITQQYEVVNRGNLFFSEG